MEVGYVSEVEKQGNNLNRNTYLITRVSRGIRMGLKPPEHPKSTPVFCWTVCVEDEADCGVDEESGKWEANEWVDW